MNYLIPFLNGAATIDNPTIILHGKAMGNINEGVSQGGFAADVKLTIAGGSFTLRVESGLTQPTQKDDLDSILEWAIQELDTQYGVQ